MSFFTKGKQLHSSKRAKFSNEHNKKRKVVKPNRNEEITSSEDEDLVPNNVPDASSSEDENETAQEKKLRLAKVYLQEIEREEKLRLENKEIDEANVSKRLKEDYLSQVGKLRLTVADKYKETKLEDVNFLKCREQRDSLTCLCITADDKYLFTGSKDGNVIKYSLLENKKVGIIPFTKKQNGVILGHGSKIHSLAVSNISNFLAIGDDSNNIYIWDAVSLKYIKTLSGHKKPVTGLCFKKDANTLYSCSQDRSVKVWSLDDMAYIETLFGHQEAVSSIDTLYKSTVVTSGGRDLRIWKINEETQLIFNGHTGNIDNVKFINEENFISGGDDGQICVWSTMRKKPVSSIDQAHGFNSDNSQPYWITSLTSLLNTDLIASGSNDGFIRLWKLENNFKLIKPMSKIPINGFINFMAFTSDGKKLIAACSKEYRLGRWSTVKEAKNGVYVISLNKN